MSDDQGDRPSSSAADRAGPADGSPSATDPSRRPRTNGDHVSSDRIVHLRAARPWSGNLDRARIALGDGLPSWLGRRLDDAPEPERRTFETDLALPLQAPGTAFVFRKAAIVEIGEIEVAGPGLRVPVSWRSATLAPLFPVFVGSLTVAPGRIVLDGFYAPPAGEVGVVLDRAFLNMAARRTAGWFIGRVAEAIGD